MPGRIKPKILMKRKFAEVDYDVFGLDREFTPKGRERLKYLWESYIADLKQRGLSCRNITRQGGKSSGTFQVLKEDADRIGSQLEEILNDPECLHVPEHLREDHEWLKQSRENRRRQDTSGT